MTEAEQVRSDQRREYRTATKQNRAYSYRLRFMCGEVLLLRLFILKNKNTVIVLKLWVFGFTEG